MARTFTRANPASQFITQDPKETEGQVELNITPKENKSARTQLLLQPSVKEGIRLAAAQYGVSLNDFINSILKNWLENHK